MRRHGSERRRVWRKVHLAVDAGSHEIRAAEMADHRHGDGEILPDLLAQVAEEGVASVIGDGACDARSAYEAAAARNAAHLVPPRPNGKHGKTPTAGAEERNETLHAVRHLGRRLWKRWSGYHRRSLA
ncbi:transposase [Roseomonas sp. GCM10028921]